MPIRTTTTLVEGIIDLDEGDDLGPFIEVASELIDEKLSIHTKPDGSLYYGNVRLEKIERWLSAHFYHQFRLRLHSEKAGPVASQSQYKIDMYLSHSQYGQHALILDTSGILAALNQATKDGKRRTVGLTWLGTAST